MGGWEDLMNEILKESNRPQTFREEGMLQGARRILRLVLEGRFGSLTDHLLAAINGADGATLEQVAAHAATDTLEQLRQRLGLR